MKIELRKTFQFEAAHKLPNVPADHKCARLHGHSFRVEVVVCGECDPHMGWLMDYSEISEAFLAFLQWSLASRRTLRIAIRPSSAPL